MSLTVRTARGRSPRQLPTRVRLSIEALEDRTLLANGLPTPDHVVMVIEENHSFSSIIGNPSAPYINSLANDPYGALFTQSFAIEHPSQPNYLDLFAGSNQGVTDDNLPVNAPFTTNNLGAALLAKGLTFTGYFEDLPFVGYNGVSSGAYVRRHNPVANWQGASSQGVPASANQPFASFSTGNYRALPTVSIVVPNLNNDMHDGSIFAGDTWLKNNLDGYVQFARANNSLLILTFDEDDFTQVNHITTIFIGSMVKGGAYGETINHFNVLRTMEDMYGLTYAGASGAVNPIADVWIPATAHILATGVDVSGGPNVRVFNGVTSALVANFFAFDPSFTGGVRVAVGDVNHDGIPDIIAAAGPSGGPHVRVFSGSTFQQIAGPLGSFFAYDPSFTGGVFVAVGDVYGDGFNDIITGADAGGGPHVRGFDGKTGVAKLGFFAYDPGFSGGVRVAAGYVNGDGQAEIITGAGPSGGPNVKVFSGINGTQLSSFFAYDPGFNGGVYVAVGSGGRVITGTGVGGGPHVKVFDGLSTTVLASFFAFEPTFTGGVTVGAADLIGDGRLDILTGRGPGSTPQVRAFDGVTQALFDDFFAYDTTYTGRIFVAGA
jgi:hypothetical protein